MTRFSEKVGQLIFFEKAIPPAIEMRVLSILVAICCIWGGLALASDLDAPMTFANYWPCEGHGSMCDPYILAKGTITSSTPDDFVRFVKKGKFHTRVFFHSPGGNLAAAIRLGRLIREFRFNTLVGGPYENVIRLWEDYEIIEKEGHCFSACAYAFLGGVKRTVESSGKFGIHQFRGATKDTGESSTQVIMTALSNYLEEMGIDRTFLDVASLADSSKLHIVTQAEAQRLNVDNTNPPKSRWRLESDSHGRLILVTTQHQAKRDGVVSVAIFYEKGAYRAFILYEPLSSMRATSDIAEIFLSESTGFLRINIDPQTSFELGTIQDWRHIGRGYSILVDFPQTAMEAIAQSRGFVLDADWFEVFRDLDPSASFGVEGFRDGFAALTRSNSIR